MEELDYSKESFSGLPDCGFLKPLRISALMQVFLLLSVFLFSVPAAFCAEDKAPVQSDTAPAQDLPLVDMYSQESQEVDVVADQLEYAKAEKKMIAKDNVVITYQDVKITADYAEVETDTKKAHARGHVFVFHGSDLASKGEEIYYDFKNRTGEFPDASTISEPWILSGADMHEVKEGVIVIQNGCLTTCEGENPPYKIRAKKTTIVSEDKILAKNVTVYVMNKPVFWLPYLNIPLHGPLNVPFSIRPGYNSEYGAFIETVKGFSINKNISGKILADWRAKRGFGIGSILDYDYSDKARGQIVGYWTQDERAPTPTLLNPYDELEDRDRGRLTWRHRTDFDPKTNLIFRYHRAADEYFLRDFFQREDRFEREQSSFAAFTKNTEKLGFLAHVQKRMNSFESVVERLPQIRVDWKNQPFLNSSRIFYENQSSFDYLDLRLNRSDDRTQTARFDSFHEWSMPLNWNNIKFTPFANMRGTYYSRDRDTHNDRFRFALGFGTDVRTQFYKTYQTSFEKFGIEVNNLRHIFEPSVTWTAIQPSTVSDETLTHFDRIDTIDDSNVIRFGLENRLQTKRVVNGKMQRVDIVSLNTFLNYEFHPDGLSSASHFKTLSQEVTLRPYNWLTYQMRFDIDTEHGNFQVFNQDLKIDLRRFSFLFGHRLVNDPTLLSSDGGLDTSNLVLVEARYKLNRIWELGGYLRFDADDSDLEEWQIYATRDFDCILLDIGYNVRSSAINSSNKELFFNLRLKDYPGLELRTSGVGRASFAPPRIGETVAGANQFSGGFEAYNS